MSPNQALPVVTTGTSPEYIERFADLLGASFINEPLNRWITLYTESLPNETVLTPEKIAHHFLPDIQKKVEAGAPIAEAGNWAAAAQWFPPGIKRPSQDPPQPILQDFEDFDVQKQKHVAGREYWYFNLIGRQPGRTERGVVRALIEPYLQKAREAGLPAWVEALDEHGRDIYAHFGFRTVVEACVGKDIADAKGNRVEGGEGIMVYGMIAEPN